MTLADKVVKAALAEVGYHEGRSGGSWNNVQKYAPAVPGLEWAQGQAWCATFVAWAALQAGAAELYPVTASCDVAANWFKARSRWSAYPAVGAQMFLGTAADYTHTGLVVRYDDTYVWTAEGNTNDSGSREGDGVYLKRRTRASVGGYGLPRFPDGIVSADPRYAHEAPKPVKPAVEKPKPKPAPRPARATRLAAGVRPRRRHRQVPDVKGALIEAGYARGIRLWRKSTLYGPGMRKAVARFHAANPRFASKSYDPELGPQGWAFLQKKIGRV